MLFFLIIHCYLFFNSTQGGVPINPIYRFWQVFKKGIAPAFKQEQTLEIDIFFYILTFCAGDHIHIR